MIPAVVGIALMLLQIEASAPPTNPVRIWDKMMQTYAKMNACEISTTTTAREGLESDSQSVVRTVFQFKRPNLLRLEQRDTHDGKARTTLIVCDGKKLYAPLGDQIIGRDAPTELSGILRYFDKTLPDNGFYLNPTLANKRENERFFGKLKNLQLKPKEKIGETECHVLSAEYVSPDGVASDLAFYIGAGDSLLHKMTVAVKITIIETDPKNNKQEEKTSILNYEWIMKHNTSPKFDNKTFSAPKNAIIP